MEVTNNNYIYKRKNLKDLLPIKPAKLFPTQEEWNELLKNKQSRDLFFVDSPCSSGKTYSLVETISNLNRESIIILIDTIKLGKEIETKLLEHGVDNFQFYNNDDRESYETNSVKQETINYLHGCKNNNKKIKLIMTKAMFSLLKIEDIDGIDTSTINIIKDELLFPIQIHSLCVPYRHNLFTDLFNVEDYDSDLYKITLKENCRNDVENIILGSYDAINNMFTPLLLSLLNDNLITIEKSEYDRIVKDEKIFTDKGISYAILQQYGNAKNTLNFIDFSSPDRFLKYKSTTFLGANFECSMLNYVWTNFHGIVFKDNAVISKNLRFNKHQLKCKLFINYLNDNSRWSITQANKKQGNKTTIENNIEKVIDFTKELLKEDNSHKGIITQCNNTHEQLFNDINSKNDNLFTMLPVMSHGLNSYSDYRIAYSSVAQNFNKRVLGILNKNFGISYELLSMSMTKYTLYQFIMRTALRNPDNELDIHLMVANKLLAEYLASLFEGDIFIKYIDDKEYKQVDNKLSNVSKYLKTKVETMNDIINTTIENNNEEICSMIPSIYKENVSHTLRYDNKTFLQSFKDYSKSNVIENKEDNRAIINAVFNEDNITKQRSRKMDNIAYSKTFMIDIDDGDMNLNTCFLLLKRYTPYSGSLYTTFSNDEELNNRYRIAFTLDKKVTPEQYKIIADYFVKFFEKHHYYTCSNDIKNNKEKFNKWFNEIKQKDPKAKLSGIDTSKLNPYSLFFLPASTKTKKCQVKTLRLNEENIIDINVSEILNEMLETTIIEEELNKEITYNKPNISQEIKYINDDNNNNDNLNSNKNNNIIKKVKTQISEIIPTMGKGNHFLPNQKISSKIKYLKNIMKYNDWYDYYLEIGELLGIVGCNKSEMKNYYQYASS